MEPLYQPQGIEERWQRTWEDEGLYSAEPGSGRETFVDRAPAAERDRGAAHGARADRSRSQDALVRWHRMRGFETAFLTGFDHAGISTQNAVEKHLAGQGKTRQELGRETVRGAGLGLAPRVRRHDHGAVPAHGRLDGLPARALHDGRRVHPRGDALLRAPARQRAGSTAANRIINWCPFHETSLSDLELVHEEVDDALTYVRYPFADDPDGGVTIATARPATILGGRRGGRESGG